MFNVQQIVFVVPIYKNKLDIVETLNLMISVSNSPTFSFVFAAPFDLDVSWYEDTFPFFKFEFFDSSFFLSIESYNHLMTSRSFYLRFRAYEFIFLVQTDAVVRARIDFSDFSDFDYLGAPWFNPFRVSKMHFGSFFFSAVGRLLSRFGCGVTVAVGNGGLSVRRTSAFLHALTVAQTLSLKRHSMPEDIYFASLGVLFGLLRLPEPGIAHTFFCEANCEDPLSCSAKGFHSHDKHNFELASVLRAEFCALEGTTVKEHTDV